MEPSELESKRSHIGVIAALLLIGSLFVSQFYPHKTGLMASLMRTGIVMGAFWLAIPLLLKYPKLLRRLPWYLVGTFLVLLSLGKQLLWLIPMFLLLALLTMFAPTKGGSRRRNRDTN